MNSSNDAGDFLIGIIVALVVFLAAAPILLWLRRYLAARRARSNSDPSSADALSDPEAPAEASGAQASLTSLASHISNRSIHELTARRLHVRDRRRSRARSSRRGADTSEYSSAASAVRQPDEAVLRWAAETQMDDRAPESEHKAADGKELLICAVCLDEVDEGSKKRTLLCNHEFHSACIEKWLVKANRCPVCNRAVFDEVTPPTQDTTPANVFAADEPSAFQLNVLVSSDRGEHFHYQTLGPRTTSTSSLSLYYFAPH